MSDLPKKSSSGQVLAGLGIGCLIQIVVLVLFLAFVTSSILNDRSKTTLITLLGTIQALFILPAVIYARKRGRSGMVAGLIIIASIGFLVGGICGLMMLH